MGGVASGVALGLAGWAAVKRARQPRIMGVRVPRELTNLDAKKIANGVDLKKVAKQVGKVAEQVEARSEDVRVLSQQAKRLSKKLS
jgi:hypothetical protein